MLVEYIQVTFGLRHSMAVVAVMHIHRLQSLHPGFPGGEKQTLACRVRAITAQYLWEHDMTRAQQDAWWDENDKADRDPLSGGLYEGLPFLYPYMHTCPAAVLLAAAHAFANPPAEILDQPNCVLLRRRLALEYSLQALKVMEKAYGEWSSRLAAPLSLAAKICKQGTVEGVGPDLDMALLYAQKAVDVLSKAMGLLDLSGRKQKLQSSVSGTTGNATFLNLNPNKLKGWGKKLCGSYVNIYQEFTPSDLANAYVALAEVERSKGMASDAGAHFTIAGDILLKNSNEMSNMAAGDKGGKLASSSSSDKIASSSSSSSAAAAAARCPLFFSTSPISSPHASHLPPPTQTHAPTQGVSHNSRTNSRCTWPVPTHHASSITHLSISATQRRICRAVVRFGVASV